MKFHSLLFMFFFSFLLFSSWNLQAQDSLQSSPVFPDDYLGDWYGTLEIFNAKGKVQELPYGIAFSCYGFIPTAGSGPLYMLPNPEMRRKYELVLVDSA